MSSTYLPVFLYLNYQLKCVLITNSHIHALSFQQEFPNFQVDVYATVLDNGGSALAAAIMAASLALANAGVPMFGLVTASTIVNK